MPSAPQRIRAGPRVLQIQRLGQAPQIVRAQIARQTRCVIALENAAQQLGLQIALGRIKQQQPARR
ncbi:hypothetical protein VT52_024595 [Streptomyces malaysiense]|uniref:Uncharacterized protein n=1 Tax=Streptomyces malaysiense TaxID=1428626 RepID=A0A1J4PY76_9ACTN|nr:hypothetical protein VT52_024595 [Streptomyces malaysiense]